MEFSISEWLEKYQKKVANEFGNRIWFLGLQGSYGRGEASEQSDIDVVLILDQVSAEDLYRYGKLLDTLPDREKICGFVSGKEELLNWEPSDLFQFYYDTVPVMGLLDGLLSRIRPEDIRRAVHTGACNIYHMCGHNLLHEKSADILRELYKSAFFALQAAAFLQTGVYMKKKTDLMTVLSQKEKNVLEKSMELQKRKDLSETEFREWSAVLLEWASDRILQERDKKYLREMMPL